jgi:hypothetical protein
MLGDLIVASLPVAPACSGQRPRPLSGMGHVGQRGREFPLLRVEVVRDGVMRFQ